MSSATSKVPNVTSLFGRWDYQAGMLARIKRHDGFCSRQTLNGVRNALCIRMDLPEDWPFDWLQGLCLYYKRDGILYLSTIESVQRDGLCFYLIYAGFRRVLSGEYTPACLEPGINIAASTRNSRCPPGQAIFGHTTLPILPSHR